MVGLAKRTYRQVAALALLVGFTMVATQANAGHLHAIAEGPHGNPTVNIPRVPGTYSLRAFSQQTSKPAAGPNASSSDSTKAPPVPAGAVAAPNNEIRVGILPPDYSPVVGFANKQKPKGGTTEVTSTSGDVTSSAEANFDKLTLNAKAKVPEGVSGRAAAEALDPFALPTGVYDYAYSISLIELETEKASDWAGVTFFALDSRFTNPLWTLAVIAKGPIASSDDLLIDFLSNPSATSFFSVNDFLIESQARAAFNVSRA